MGLVHCGNCARSIGLVRIPYASVAYSIVGSSDGFSPGLLFTKKKPSYFTVINSYHISQGPTSSYFSYGRGIQNDSLTYAFLPLQLTQFINPTMHQSYIPQCTIQNRNMHICVLNGVLWDMGQVHSWICETGLLRCLGRKFDIFIQRCIPI